MEITAEKIIKYRVMRNDIKISDEEMTLEEATDELNRLEARLKKWPDGSKLRLEQINN